jgi:protein-disulfide isomerase
VAKRPETKAAQPRNDLRTSPLVIGGLVVIAILVVLVLIQSNNRGAAAAQPVPTYAAQGVETGLTPEGYPYRGSLTAKVIVVEFEDLRCPYCRQYFMDTEPQVLETYVKVGLVREESHLVAFLGPASHAGAEAAACAGDQGKFWEFRHEAFANQKDETATPVARADFVQYAQTIGLDQAKFTNCFDTLKHSALVDKTMTDAQNRGVQATPSFFVNSTLYQGAFPFTAEGDQPNFKNILDTALGLLGGTATP